MARPKTKTKAQSTNEYAKKNYDAVRLNIRKGAKEIIRLHAKSQNTSLQGYIKNLISTDMGIDV